jgi:single-strand DNA-binding protein
MAELTVVGVGVATTDSELRRVGQNDTAVCSVNLAFNRSFKNKKTDEWEQEATFVRVQVWGNRAERMVELVKKGQPVYVTGYLKQDSWETDEGVKKVAYTINARDFQLCVKNGKKKSNNEESAAPAKASSTSQTQAPPPSDDDIPF